MEDKDLRRRFREFLQRLIAGTSDLADWDKYAINHYEDEFVEDIRRETVRIMIKHSPVGEKIPLTTEVKNAFAELSGRLDASAT